MFAYSKEACNSLVDDVDSMPTASFKELRIAITLDLIDPGCDSCKCLTKQTPMSRQ